MAEIGRASWRAGVQTCALPIFPGVLGYRTDDAGSVGRGDDVDEGGRAGNLTPKRPTSGWRRSEERRGGLEFRRVLFRSSPVILGIGLMMPVAWAVGMMLMKGVEPAT